MILENVRLVTSADKYQHTYVRSHVRPLVHTRPSTRTSRVRPLVRLHVRWVVRTSVTTLICTRAPYVHFLPRNFKNTFYEIFKKPIYLAINK